MQKINESHVFTGMQRDVSASKQPMQFLYNARNIRLTAREGDTLFSITNEKGPGGTGISIAGKYVGHCLLNNFLVIFSKGSGMSTITRIDLDKTSQDTQQGVVVLYSGTLDFGDHIEAIASYENDGVQKIYWTDGFKQPRVINIADSRIATRDKGNPSDYTPFNAESFDFIRKLKLKEEVSVEKLLGASGVFAPGVIQYAFTYFNKYGQETNIFYTTPLLYVSHRDRGASPEDKVDNAFRIKLKNVDSVFEFLRVYSVERTSIDATPYCRRVIDVSLEGITDNEITVVDTGTIGDAIDPIELLYKGGESIVAQTLEQKDNTLFLGNLKISRESVASFKDAVQKKTVVNSDYRYFQPLKISEGSYNYSNQLTSVEVIANTKVNPTTYTVKKKSVPCAGFKRGDYYRLGVQFQHNTGKWSDPIFLKDYQQSNSPEEIIDENIIKTPVFKGTITDDETLQPIAKLVEAGYLKVRAVAVYPTPQDRVVVCQGVSNPTLRFPLEKDDFGKDYPRKTWSSWFFRPQYIVHREGVHEYDSIRNDGSATPFFAAVDTTNDTTNDTVLEYTNNNLGSTEETEGGTTVYHTGYNPINIRFTEIQGDFKSENKLYINYDYNTLHSPDIEFDDSLSIFDFTGLNARNVGKTAFINTLADIDIQTETPAAHNLSGGFIHKSFIEPYSAGIVAGLFYEDFYLNDFNDSDGGIKAVDEQKKPFKWMIYPWQKNGSLNNDFNRPADKGIQTALLKKKVISNLRYANSFYDSINSDYDFIPNAIQLFSSNEVSLLKFDDAYYMGNIDTLLSADNVEGQYFAFDGEMSLDHNISDSDTAFNSNNWHKTFSMSDTEAKDEGLYKFNRTNRIWDRVNNRSGEDYLQLVINKAQVRIKYKSTPHLVVSVDKDDWEYMFESPDMQKRRYSTLPIIEIIRPGDNSDKPYYRATMFGGTSEDAIRANKWIPCGEPVSLVDGNGEAKDSVEFEYSYGDTYYQRWDCLKTYPFTHEDPNQIVEIGSFMLETHVNIDGRYDRNRGQLNNLNMSPQNFNLLNPIYSQVNNFFNYRILDADYYKNNIFPNQITWTKEKQAGADVDLWTNITLASTYDMDGSKGEIISLNTWKDNIFCFQPKGVSTILFNSRVQIPTSDGVPIEITNNYKVDGYRYIGDGVGCKNKWTIKETPSGVYFIDSISKHLFVMGEGLQDISASHNMALWFKQNNIDKTLYDEVNHDIYLVNENESLCYSEILSQFTSFMDYKDIKLIESHNNKIFTLKKPTLENSSGQFYLYQMFEGAPCNFFGENCPWYITFISNGFDNSFSGADKIFTNIEFRTTVDSETKDVDAYTDYLPLDYIYAENDYQTSEETELIFEHDEASNLKRKFRIWRCDIPRAKGGFNRLRNPWLKITLKKNATSLMEATELHDLIVNYYV